MKPLACLLFLSATAALSAPNFQRQEIDSAIEIGYGLAVGDVDGDNKDDILLADKSVVAWYRNPGEKGAWKRHVMAQNLNPRVGLRFLDNVCIAARDIDGDGRVEVAVGGNWNPGETTDVEKSGSVHILERPEDPTKPWTARKLDHLPTIHRMVFAKVGDTFELLALPLHGIGNQNTVGESVRLLRYAAPDWKMRQVDTGLHAAHNFDLLQVEGQPEALLIAGKQGLVRLSLGGGDQQKHSFHLQGTKAAGEVRGSTLGGQMLLAAIEPMHGADVAVYRNGEKGILREVIDTKLSQGHALAIADVLGTGRLQVIAGWRRPDENKRVGIKIYEHVEGVWKSHLLDDNTMACEDLKISDLNGDGKPEIIAAGRASKNLVIYWNKG